MKKHLFSFALVICTLFFSTHSCYSQGLAVNTDGTTADPSAMLDVKATNKGVLVPRLTSVSNVTSPVTGLLVYQTGAPAGFYYYDGAAWLLLQNSGNIIAASNGGAGSVNGILKADGSGTVSAAVAGTDYLTPDGNGGGLTSLNATSLSSGTVPAARLGTGTADATTFLEGDGKWVVPPAGGGIFPNIITATTALTILTTTGTYQNMKSITLPSTGYYLITAFVNITTHQIDDEYHARMTQGGTILTGSVDYFAVDGMLSLSTVVTVTAGNLGTPVLIQCNNSGMSSGMAIGAYSVVKLSN